MRELSQISRGAGGTAMISVAVILLFVYVALLVFALSDRRRPALAAVCTAATAVLAASLTLMLDGIYVLDWLPYERGYATLTAAFYRLPWLVPVLLEGLLAGLAAFLTVRLGQIRRTEVSSYTVKEAVDSLPVGVCISDPRTGSVTLSNLKMNEAFSSVAQRPLTDARELPELFREDESGHCKTEENDYLLTRGAFEIGGRTYTETTLDDQTEQYRKMRELEEKNTRLIDLQLRLKTYRVRSEDLLIKRELLEARKTVHSELGAALLTGKYRFEHPENVDEKELLAMLWQINTYLLAEVEEPEDVRDEYAAALKIAERIGVRVTQAGSPPRDEPYRSVIGLALGECAANTVKHAGGDEVTVVFTESGGSRAAVITNNGAPPEKGIRELGGLLSIRMAAEAAGMELACQSAPVFSLTLRYPAKAPDQ